MAAPVLQFEKHAGMVLKNQNAHIFLRNGTSLYELFHALRVVLADRFAEAFRMVAGAPMTVPAVNGAPTEQGQRLEQQPASRELDGLQAVDVTAEQAPLTLDMLTEEQRAGLCFLDLSLNTQALTFTRKASTFYLLHKSLLQAIYVKEDLCLAGKRSEQGFGMKMMVKATL